jgi:2-polyprenyl-6-methoxyphenol hydroxylase-like FAD-dependent oxidoreductase
MTLPSERDVVIVGAGPVGLALAAELRRRGVSALALDRLEEGANTSRAAAVHARTLEVLETLGITEDLLSRGVRIPTFRVRDRDRELLNIDFTEIPSKYRFVLMIPQNETEALLAARLKALGGELVRSCEVTSLRQENDSATVIARRNGTETQIRARYVIGCDGMHSAVREQAGIEFEGGSYESAFILGDVTMDWPIPRKEVSLFFSPAGLFVVAPLPHDRFRIVATVDQAPEHPTVSDLQQLLVERGPALQAGRIHSLIWSARFRIHHRVAKTLKKGHVLILGDAAHVHSPAGGQGMNTGIQDAIALGETLSLVLNGAPEAKLDEWEQSRREIARRVVALTDRMTRMATVRSHSGQGLRNAVLAAGG